MKSITFIGGGPGGYEGAIRAAQLGFKVHLIEEEQLGGTCLNKGCIPTKTYWKSAFFAEEMRKMSGYGFPKLTSNANGEMIYERKEEVLQTNREGIKFIIDNHPNIMLNYGRAKFISPTQLEVTLAKGKKEILSSDYFVVATGAVSRKIDFPGHDLPGLMDSEQLLKTTRIPKRLVVIGTGVIGLEFASIYKSFGTDVDVIGTAVLPRSDQEMARRLIKYMRRRGIHIHTGYTVKEIQKCAMGFRAISESREGDKQLSIEGDAVLVAVGRVANTNDLGLEEAGVDYDGGGIITNDISETTAPGIYAVGDVAKGNIQLAHVASAQAISLVERLAGMTPNFDMTVIPSCIFTLPEVASVGFSEEDLVSKNIAFRKSKVNFRTNGKALSLGETEGFIKVLASHDGAQIFGVHCIGPHASDLIHEGAQGIRNALSVEQMSGLVHAHPTLGETFNEALHGIMGSAIHLIAQSDLVEERPTVEQKDD